MEATETQRIEKAADHAMAALYNSGARIPDHLSRGDLKQAAREAALAGLAVMDRAFSANEQEAYLARRALGGIQDACWARRRGKDQRLRQQEHDTISLDALPDHLRAAAEPVDAESPEVMALLKQACDAIADMPHPLPTIITMKLDGHSGDEIARVLGVTSGRVSQLCGEIIRRLGRYITIPQEFA